MKFVFKPQRPYHPQDGSFNVLEFPKGEIPVIKDMFTCRDRFQRVNAKLDKFIFYSSHCENAVRFIKQLEKMMELKPSVFTETIDTCAVLVKWNKFWLTPMRRNLFTALLRDGRNYHGDFWQTVDLGHYLRKTKKALEKFMNGYTNFQGDKNIFGEKRSFKGWVDEFEYASDKKLECLVKPRWFSFLKHE